MIVQDLFQSEFTPADSDIIAIRTECSDFLEAAGELPLLKALPISYPNFKKIKVRRQKHQDIISEIFDHAFHDKLSNIRQRAVFSYPSLVVEDATLEPFYIFPLNGFKLLYSKEVVNSNASYQDIVGALVECIDDHATVAEMVTSLVRQTYTDQSLVEGIKAGAEIILYGIPYYYGIRASKIAEYQSLLNIINNRNLTC